VKEAGYRRPKPLLASGHVRADLVARYNKDQAWQGRSDAFVRVSAHVAALIGARQGAAAALRRLSRQARIEAGSIPTVVKDHDSS
jgi:hypothetical protein